LMVRVVLPYHLQTLARVKAEVQIDVAGPVTIRSVIDSLEQRYPTLRGTICEYGTRQRRAYLRFFACGEDLSLEPMDAPLPDRVMSGEMPFVVLGAIAGG
jgi:sulfur-carrier protein